MPVIDFSEIAQANVADGRQDSFELFGRDFLEMLGFRIVSGPDRGQDGGRDVIAIESRLGIVGETQIKWLVSCKHKSHSGKSVTNSDEKDIGDRLRAHGASGFLGIYSTTISSPLGRKLEGLKQHFEVMVFDNERIENQLLQSEEGKLISKRYFPKSFAQVLYWNVGATSK
jgi:hypothetical protein